MLIMSLITYLMLDYLVWMQIFSNDRLIKNALLCQLLTIKDLYLTWMTKMSYRMFNQAAQIEHSFKSISHQTYYCTLTCMHSSTHGCNLPSFLKDFVSLQVE